jgi:hypothetical protein
MIDQLLERVGLKYEDLSVVEKETLNSWLEVLQKGHLSVKKVKEYINSMKEAVEKELTKSDLGSKQDLFLKARLRNYILLDSFLTTPEKAKEEIENIISGLVERR